MTTDQDMTRIVRSWLRAGDDESAGAILESVLARLEDAPQRRRVGPARGSPRKTGFAVAALSAAAVFVVAIVGMYGLRGGTGPGGLEAPTTPAPTATPRPTPRSVAALLAPAIGVGFIGLPPEGATPSDLGDGVLVDSVLLNPYSLPYMGTAWLYDDGRLIWYRFYDGPDGMHSESTGYLEQRLSPEGIELYRNRGSRYDKNPLLLPDWLPSSAWEDQQIRPYVPTGFAVCIEAFDPRAPIEDRDYPRDGPPMDRSVALALLPDAAADLLRTVETLPPIGDAPDCIALSTDDARLLDRALREGGLDQDPQQNKYVLTYQRDVPGTESELLFITFEPRMPDGSYNCSSCG